jgi:hypothetical protein
MSAFAVSVSFSSSHQYGDINAFLVLVFTVRRAY